MGKEAVPCVNLLLPLLFFDFSFIADQGLFHVAPALVCVPPPVHQSCLVLRTTLPDSFFQAQAKTFEIAIPHTPVHRIMLGYVYQRNLTKLDVALRLGQASYLTDNSGYQ